MRVLGLDLSLTAPGAVVLAKERGSKLVETLSAEQIPVPAASKMGRWDRVVVIGDEIVRLVEHYEPSMVVIEGYGQVSHGGVQSFIKCVEVGTLVRLLLHAKGLSWLEVPPTSLKTFVCGKGKKPSGAAGKKEMVRHVGERWNFVTKNHNIADAYGLARFGLASKGVVAVEPWQCDVVSNVAGA